MLAFPGCTALTSSKRKLQMLNRLIDGLKRKAVAALNLVEAWRLSGSVDVERITRAGGFEAVLRLAEGLEGAALIAVLRNLGAQLGEGCRVHRGLCFHNAAGSLSHLSIGRDCHIGRQVLFDLAEPISIGDRVTISMRCTLLTHTDVGDAGAVRNAPGINRRAAVRVEDDVYIGAGALVMAGITLGAGSIIGAGAVVSRNVAPGAIVAGVPARALGSATP